MRMRQTTTNAQGVVRLDVSLWHRRGVLVMKMNDAAHHEHDEIAVCNSTQAEKRYHFLSICLGLDGHRLDSRTQIVRLHVMYMLFRAGCINIGVLFCTIRTFDTRCVWCGDDATHELWEYRAVIRRLVCRACV